MNVLHISLHRDRRISSQANWMVQQGHTVSFATLWPDRVCEDFDPRIRIVLPSSPAPSGLLHRNRLAEWKRGFSRAILPNSLHRFLLMLYACLYQVHFRFVPEFMKLELTEAYNVIHVHDLPSLAAGVALRESRFPGALLVYDMHEWTPEQYENRWIRRLVYRNEKKLIHHADRVITVNDFLAEGIRESYHIPRPAVLFNSYAPVPSLSSDTCSLEQFRRHFGLQNDRFVFLFQGGLTPGRNIETMIRAFQGVPDANLLLLGSGEMENSFRRLKAKQNIHNVYFAPPVPQTQLIDFVRHADAGIICYTGTRLKNNLYCTPNKLFEFIEAMIPVCSSDLPALRQIIQGHGIGRVYPMNSVLEISRAITDFMCSMRHGAFDLEHRKGARETFCFSRQANILEDVYTTASPNS